MDAKVSLLIPCHNAAAYLPRLMDCVRAQKRPFDELLCFDDASTDDTRAVAASLGFTVLSGEGKGALGPGEARNRLAQAASGEWLHFHDADDLMAPDYLEQSLQGMAGAPGADVILCDSSWELETSRERIIHWQYRADDYKREGPIAFALSHPVGVLSALLRRECFLQIGGFDRERRCWEDADLFVRLAESGARFHCLEKTLVTSLRHDRGASRNEDYSLACRLSFLKDYAARLPEALHPTVAEQLEKLLASLLLAGNKTAAREALALCRRLGRKPPTTRHPLFQTLKPFVPALWLMKWQALHRRRER